MSSKLEFPSLDQALIATPGTGEMGMLPDELYDALQVLKKDPNFLFVPATGPILADALQRCVTCLARLLPLMEVWSGL
jgi:hypothetical protein